MTKRLLQILGTSLIGSVLVACGAAPDGDPSQSTNEALLNSIAPPPPVNCAYDVAIAGYQTDVYCDKSSATGDYVLQALEGGVYKSWVDKSSLYHVQGNCDFTLGYEESSLTFRVCSVGGYGWVNGVYQQLRSCTGVLPPGSWRTYLTCSDTVPPGPPPSCGGHIC